MNILGSLIILAILVSLFYPVYLAGCPGEKARVLTQQKSALPWSSDFWTDPEKYFPVYAYIPMAVIGTVFAATVLLVARDLRQIPKYVELSEEGVKIGRWLAPEEYIPYRDITEVYERPFYGFVAAAVCLRTSSRGKFFILKYAYSDWEELYRRLREKTMAQRFTERLWKPV